MERREGLNGEHFNYLVSVVRGLFSFWIEDKFLVEINFK